MTDRNVKLEDSSSQTDSQSQNDYNILRERIEKLENPSDLDIINSANTDPRPYSVWNFQLDNRFRLRYPGNIPAGLVLNTSRGGIDKW